MLYEYVARHNLGVRHGDWEALGECFADDAVLEFEGIPIGPFAGRDAIVAAYSRATAGRRGAGRRGARKR